MLLTFWCGSTAASHTRRDLCCSFGTGEFINDPSRHRVEPGEVLFVPAGRKHRVEFFQKTLVHGYFSMALEVLKDHWLSSRVVAN
ncbi:hypothetical protein SPB21_25935 [Leptothoe sp. ISB3NOV94-8A]